MKYKNTTFVNILLICSHDKPGKPFLKGAPFFGNPLYISKNQVKIATEIFITYTRQYRLPKDQTKKYFGPKVYLKSAEPGFNSITLSSL